MLKKFFINQDINEIQLSLDSHRKVNLYIHRKFKNAKLQKQFSFEILPFFEIMLS